MNIKLGSDWSKKLAGQIDGWEFEVGVIEDKPHYEPVESKLFGKPALKSYAGGPAQQQSRKVGPLSTGEVLVENMKRLNINLLQRPFRERNSDILKFTDAFLKLALKRPGMSIKRVENLLQAIVRNPILKQEYGENKSATADAKGFNRHLIGTAQMFKAIIAKATKRG